MLANNTKHQDNNFRILKSRYYLISFLSILFLLTNTAFSQVRLGDFTPSLSKMKKSKQKDIANFIDGKITFYLSDEFSISDYETILKETWTVTDYEVLYIKDYNLENLKPGNSYALLHATEGRKRSSDGLLLPSGVYASLRFNLLTEVIEKNKKKPKKVRVKNLGYLFFTYLSDKNGRVVGRRIYDDTDIVGDLRNYKLGYLKNFLQFTNAQFKNGGFYDMHDDYFTDELKNLENKTLYIDTSLLADGHDFIIGKDKIIDKNKITDSYSYNIEYIDSDDLQKKILTTTGDFYYLMYNQIPNSKLITVINGKTGTIVYSEHQYASNNIKKKDFTQLKKKIDKSLK